MRGIISAAALLLATPALAWNEPEDFRGVPWGASVDEAKIRIPTLVCVPLQGTCRESFKLGPGLVYSFWTFRNGGLDQVNLTFGVLDFPDIKAIFVERYGEPTSRRTQPIRSAGDAPIENEILEWTGERAHVEIRRFHRGTEQGAATIRTRAGLEEAARRRPPGSKSD